MNCTLAILLESFDFMLRAAAAAFCRVVFTPES
jgi:hypothetical protein